MFITGLDIDLKVRESITPYIRAYRDCVLRDVIPVLSNLEDRANAIANAQFLRLGETPASEDCDGDMSFAEDVAQRKGQEFYDTMGSVRQATLNLFTAGLFHLLEQQLADLCHDGSFGVNPLEDTSLLKHIAPWYRDHFGLELLKLRSWGRINELRLLANSVKHGEGRAVSELRELRPDLFLDPIMRKCFPDLNNKTLQGNKVRRPMAGQDIFVTKQVFSEYGKAAVGFTTEIAKYFASHKKTRYPLQSLP